MTEEFETAVQCPVCLDTFSQPMILPCQHTYCKPCLQRLSSNSCIKCPECRAVHMLGSQSIDGFAANRALGYVCDVIKKSKGTINAKCPSCKSKASLSLCKCCEVPLCKQCSHSHMQKIYGDFTVAATLCIKKHKNTLLTMQMQQEAIIEEQKLDRGQIEASSEQLRSYYAALIEDIQAERTVVLHQLTDCKNNQERKCLQRERMLVRINAIIRRVKDIERSCNAVTYNKQIHLQTSDLRQSMNSLENEVDLLKTDFTNLNDDPEMCYEVSYSMFEKISPNWVTLKLTSMALDRTLLYQLKCGQASPDVEEVEERDDDQPQFEEEHSMIHSSLSSDRRLCYSSQWRISIKIYPSCCAYLANPPSILIASRFSKNIHIYTLEGESKGTIDLQLPYVLCMQEVNSTLLVSHENGAIVRYSVEGVCLGSFLESGCDGIHRLQRPEYMCVDQSSMHVFVCDRDMNQVHKYTSEGQRLSNWRIKLGLPSGMTACNGTVFICECSSANIWVYDEFGTFVRDIALDQGLPRNIRPYFICSDTFGNLYIKLTDDKVIRFTQDGQVTSEMVIPTATSEHLWALTVGPSGNIYVTTRSKRNHSNFLSSFHLMYDEY